MATCLEQGGQAISPGFEAVQCAGFGSQPLPRLLLLLLHALHSLGIPRHLLPAGVRRDIIVKQLFDMRFAAAQEEQEGLQVRSLQQLCNWAMVRCMSWKQD